MKYLIEDTTLTAIGDAVRTKGGTSDLIKVSELPNAIINLPSGGGGEGGVELPEEAFVITGDCTYRFTYDGWNWFIDTYGNQITTKDISNCEYMFYHSRALTSIPFDINCSPNTKLAYMFNYAQQLREIPKIVAPQAAGIGSLFGSCYNLREITEENVKDIDFSYINTNSSANISNMFKSCYSLRKIPDSFIAKLYNTATNRNYALFYGGFTTCTSLDEILNIPLPKATITSNIFSSTCSSCFRLKNFTFAVQEDGTPYTWNAKAQTFDLSSKVGYGGSASYEKTYITGYNSGITADKEVKDDATYQALKDDPDWFSCDVNYSRYNHDSAVNTINSLPDTSAYLATAGGTNTIKFKGASGTLTDGGAINTLTEEEIAVAAAKGWTVSLS